MDRKKILGMLAASLLVFGSACRQDSGEEEAGTKTLDNFAANQKLRTNQCRIAEDAVTGSGAFNKKYEDRVLLGDRLLIDVADEAKKATLRQELMIALTAVPAYSQKVFAAFEGKIRVTADVSRLCGAAFSDKKSAQYVDEATRDKIDGCWSFFDDGAGSAGLAVILAPEVDAIRHNTVRIFGYLHAQFYPRVKRNLGGEGAPYFVDQEDNPDFQGYKEAVANKFFADMLASSVFDVDSLSHLLGKGEKGAKAKRIAANLKAGKHPAEGLSLLYPGEKGPLGKEQIQVRRQRLADYIFAEAYDSYYCRPAGSFDEKTAAAAKTPEDIAGFTNTRAVMVHYFKRTHAEFDRLILPAISQAAVSLAGKISEAVQGKPPAASLREAKDLPKGSGFGLRSKEIDFASLKSILDSMPEPVRPVPPNSELDQATRQAMIQSVASLGNALGNAIQSAAANGGGVGGGTCGAAQAAAGGCG